MIKEAKPFVIAPKVMSMHKELSVKSRVRGDFHARFCERVRVKLPRSTRPVILLSLWLKQNLYTKGNSTCCKIKAKLKFLN